MNIQSIILLILIVILPFVVTVFITIRARGILKTLVNEHHGDKYIKVSKSKIVIESVGRRTDFLRRCFR